MAKFTFSMESILKIKYSLEEQKKQEFGMAMKKLEAEKILLNSLNKRREDSVATFKVNVSSAINPKESADFSNYIEALKFKIEEQAIKVKRANAEVEKKREELVEATKEKKKFEKLKENQHENYIIEEKRSEQRVTDEIVSYKYNS
ncbi:flagellar export protein FliJ [Anaeropeptidivorans aminofermentans]|uniref:flagellar export protein FliJ n=1 Tax=Anaeropeptidivorans aminofermentans TaxID=2934315 RepID=UPI0020244DBE|nr:flagellar export protein FliJ [Anaeropeptidivorans aminofermentans]